MVASIALPLGSLELQHDIGCAPLWLRHISERNKLVKTYSMDNNMDDSLHRSLIMRLSHAESSSRLLAAQSLACIAPKGDRTTLDALLCQQISDRELRRFSAVTRGVRDRSTQVQVASIESVGEFPMPPFLLLHAFADRQCPCR